VYGASKHAMHALVGSVALEFGIVQGVHVYVRRTRVAPSVPAPGGPAHHLDAVEALLGSKAQDFLEAQVKQNSAYKT